MAATVAMVAVAATVATIAMVAVVAMLALVVLVALVVLILVLFAPKVLGRVRSAALQIDTRAGLIQAWIEYGWCTPTGQRQEETSHHSQEEPAEFHDDLPKRRGGS